MEAQGSMPHGLRLCQTADIGGRCGVRFRETAPLGAVINLNSWQMAANGFSEAEKELHLISV